MNSNTINYILGNLPGTPCYFYDIQLLTRTINAVNQAIEGKPFKVHYALKANVNDVILNKIVENRLGADCVSGNEIRKALSHGFSRDNIVFAGVGKTDSEIQLGLDNDIMSFNVESLQEIEVINDLASRSSKIASIALRLNPDVNANTHKYITTGRKENKFGIGLNEFETLIELVESCKNIKLSGLHFHIGSQITQLDDFKNLCKKVNSIQREFEEKGIKFDFINVGGGLGVDYQNPDDNKIPDFKSYFKVFDENLEIRENQTIHFELGRSIVAQSGTLITKALYEKKGIETDFIIVDAGMTELIRPALYQAYHKIQNISKAEKENGGEFDIVGPICESSDCFGRKVKLPHTKRGDLLAIRSAGAYGEVMTSRYNLKELPLVMYQR